jgi:hypothetical protein
MRRTLSEGMALGKNPRAISQDLQDATSLSKHRANLIARTEVPGSLRRARMDEDEAAGVELGIKTMQMHISAFSPTTRIWHAQRHGTLHTIQDQREWWSFSKNACNCKCSTIAVLVDDKGNPLSSAILARANKNKAANLKKLTG